MARTTNEVLLISAILNSGDVHLGQSFGLRIEHLAGHVQEYKWLLNFYTQYGNCPSIPEFLAAFPHFIVAPDITDARWSAHEIKREWSRKDIASRIKMASIALQAKDVEGAFAIFDNYKLEKAAEKPDNALVDHRFMDDYENTYEPRIEVPWPSLQQRTAGIGPGELWYFAARQGHGKSSFMIDLAAEAAMNGKSVIIYSMEMTRRQTQVRAHAALAKKIGGINVDANAMLRRTWPSADYKHLLSEIETLVPGRIHIHEVSMGLVTPSLVSTHSQDHDLSIIDYVGLMRTDDLTPAIKDYRIIAEISNGLKGVALGRHHAIIAASQINRDGVNTRTWRPPAMHTLAQSDHLGNDGDVVITMKRYGLGASVLSLEKNRHGQSGVCFWTKYDANSGDFTEITRDQADEIKMSEEDDE